MKKVLLATSILAATAGFAAAEVTLSGSARMGLLYNGEDVNFTSRARVQFTASGETDGGLSFGYSVRADQSGAANDGMGAGSVFIAGAFGRLSMGDVAGAAEAAVGDLSGVGLTGLGDFSDTQFITGDGVEVSNDNPVVLYEYSNGPISAYLSGNDGNLEGGDLFDNGAGNGASNGDDDKNYALGFKYSTDAFTAALGYENSDPAGPGADVSHIVGSVTGTFGAVNVKAVVGVGDGGALDDFEQYGLSASSTFDAVTVTAFYKALNDIPTGGDVDAFGLGASYDLGGGASVVGGIVNYDTDGGAVISNGGVGTDPTGETVADFGVTFSF